MNQYLIGAGGTGAMCIRAYLCTLAAMQAFEKDNINYKVYIRMVDMDDQSDAALKCKELYEAYRNLREQSNALPEVIFESWDFTQAVKLDFYGCGDLHADFNCDHDSTSVFHQHLCVCGDRGGHSACVWRWISL